MPATAENADQPAPFIKWAGGKRALIPHISKHFPYRINTYWEPFVGGGAVFFAISDRVDKVFLSDANEALIVTYQVVKSEVDDLIEVLREHQQKHFQDDDYYYKIREQTPSVALEIAARFIYINKTCFNGLYRVNRSGKFNVPKGRYKKPDICNEKRLRAANKALEKATLRVGDFEKTINPKNGDFIYCDPPYDSCFTSYQPGGFSADDQQRLRNACDVWALAGANVMVSNADTVLIRRVWERGERKWILNEATAPRPINANASGRGCAAELIIANY